MTGTDVIFECQTALGESTSTGAIAQAQLYSKHVYRTATDISRRTWSLYKTGVVDVIDGQVEYTLPAKPFRDGAFNVDDGYGNIRPLAIITPEEADGRFWNWRSSATLTNYRGIPRYAIAEGALTYKLLPVPNYNIIDGLMISGYYLCDKYTWDFAQECPLQVGYDEGLVAGTCYKRCIEMSRSDPSYAQLAATYLATYEKQVRLMYREALGVNDARRSGTVPAFRSRYASWSGNWGWC